MKPLNKYEKALEAAQWMETEHCEIEDGVHLWFVPCESGAHKGHVVEFCSGHPSCDCPAYSICWHVLASVGRPVAVFWQQCQWSTDIEELRLVYEHHIESLREMPESLKALARAELQAAKLRLHNEPPERAAQIAA